MSNEDGMRADQHLRRRLVDLIDYVAHMARLGEKPILALGDYRRLVYHEAKLVGRVGIEFDLTDASGPVWMSIGRIKATEPPPPPDILRPWMTVGPNPNNEPPLAVSRREIMPKADADSLIEKGVVDKADVSVAEKPDSAPKKAGAFREVVFRRDKMPEIQKAADKYLEKSWRPWAEEERVRQSTIKIYDDFFSLLQAVQTLDGADGVEVVWGMGVARWRTDGREIDHPVVEQLVDIDMDAETGRIKLRPRSIEPQVALKPFFALDKPGTDHVLQIAKEFLDKLPADKDVSPFDRGTYEPVLHEVASRIDAHGRYQGDERKNKADRSLPPIEDTLCVADTWVVYARQRSEDFFVHDLDNLKEAVEGARALPGPALRLVSEPSGRRTYTSSIVNLAKATFGRAEAPEPEDDEPADDAPSVSDEFLFPKAFNDHQMSIVRRLDRSDGVVVQGPPGTGKTHTIANIICHYLATGRRVLVTSKGEAALTVLRDHIPEGIRDLTISLLTNENEGLQQLEQAVSILAEMATAADPRALEQLIHQDQTRIIELREQMAEIDRELVEGAGRHLTPVLEDAAVGDEEGILPIDLARQIVAERDRHGWLPDRPDPDAPFEPGFEDSDIAELRAARAAVGERIAHVGKTLPDPEELPDAAAITAVHDDLVNAKRLKKRAKDKAIAAMAMAGDDAIDRVASLLERVEQVVALYEELEQEPWLLAIFEVWRQHGVDANQTALFNDMVPTIAELTERRRALMVYAPTLPEDADGDARLYEAIQRAAQGGKPIKMMTGGKALIRAQIDVIRIEGRPPRDAEDWQKVLATIDWRQDMAALIDRWRMVSEELEMPLLDDDISGAGRRISAIGDLIARAVDLLGPAKVEMEREIAELVPYGMTASEIIASRDNAEESADALRLNLSASRFARSRELLDRLVAHLGECDSPLATAMAEFVEKAIGNGRQDRAAISEEWRAMAHALQAVDEVRDEIETIERVTASIAESGAPEWAAKLAGDPVASDGADPWTPEDWRGAWAWRRRESQLRRVDNRERIAELSERRIAQEDELRQTFHRVVENRTFLGLRQAITEEIESALAAFATAVRRIGKGTGVRARRFRRDAQAAMEKCYAAVPCWIMPTWRVSETLPADLGSFDLVVVDEASQSDIGALPALLRGAKLLIVGDDKQVSPTGAFLEETRLLQLERNFLGDQPFASMMLPGTSLYELANSIFPGRRIMLREHFRCVEPIIRFSNQFYNEPIIPLRIPRASERIDPPLVDVHVVHGHKDGHQVNAIEADAIVDEIERIVADPAMAERSIGVISLIGTRQSDYIQRQLLRRIGEAAYVAHDIACGNAATFQGKERDIMFISMVECAATSSAKTTLLWEQRFNVAFSRARDRMYLFRSVDEAALSANDLKAKAVLHFREPMEAPPPHAKPEDLLDTDFERDVFAVLRERGFRVSPKIKVSSFAIDMVVEGDGDRRLAISLDGDRPETPEAWAEELARQRTLERLGWRFWRCWGSSYYADPDSCLADLAETLSELEIQPREGDEAPGAFTEHRVIGEVATRAGSGDADMAPAAHEREDQVGEIGGRVGSGESVVNQDIIEPGDRVLIAFPDSEGRQRTLTIGNGADDAASNVVDRSVLEDLIGKSIDEEVEVSVESGRHTATIVGIDKAQAAS